MGEGEQQHELIAALKDLALELGRTPTRNQFVKAVNNGWRFEHAFGTWSVFIRAAGLDLAPRKITSEVFHRSIDKHLDTYEPRPTIDFGPYPTAAVISDVHWPFPSQAVIDLFLEYVGDTKPEWAIVNGDAWDMYSHTKFPRSHNVFTPREEQARARKGNEDFWTAVRTISPNSKCVQMIGNHDLRPMKRILESYPEAEDWVAEKLKSLFTFEGVKTVHDHREELWIRDDIAVFHGYMTQLGAHRDYTLVNCINGHTHVGGVVYRQCRNQIIWELNSGLAGDPEAKGLTYTMQKMTKWTRGFGATDARGPRFIHA